MEREMEKEDYTEIQITTPNQRKRNYLQRIYQSTTDDRFEAI
jgi:hypothetical protein